MSATCSSSFSISSPPLSPSVNAVTVLSFVISFISGGTDVPSIAIEFFTPFFSRFKTSDLPSTIINESEEGTCGPAGIPASPNFIILSDLIDFSISSFISSLSLALSSNMSDSISFALSTM